MLTTLRLVEHAEQEPSGIWWNAVVDDAFSFLIEEFDLVELTTKGVLELSHWPMVAEVLIEVDQERRSRREPPLDEVGETAESRLKEAEKIAEWAHREIGSDFTLLHSHSLVLIWSAIETAVRDLCVASLRNVPELLDGEGFVTIRIPFAQFLALSDEDRLEAFLLELERTSTVQGKQGMKRLEALMKFVGLEGEMDDPRLPHEMHLLSQVRNLIVHRRGVVDRRFLEHCPDVGGIAGQRLLINRPFYVRLYLAAVHYLCVIHNRCCRVYGGADRLTWRVGGEIVHVSGHVVVYVRERRSSSVTVQGGLTSPRDVSLQTRARPARS